jgi:hypothetical protein
MQENAGGHDHHGQKPPAKPQKQDSTANCQQCCLGICVSTPDLPTVTTITPVAVTMVAYWDAARFSDGRAIKPEHGPPRLLG